MKITAFTLATTLSLPGIAAAGFDFPVHFVRPLSPDPLLAPPPSPFCPDDCFHPQDTLQTRQLVIYHKLAGVIEAQRQQKSRQQEEALQPVEALEQNLLQLCDDQYQLLPLEELLATPESQACVKAVLQALGAIVQQESDGSCEDDDPESPEERVRLALLMNLLQIPEAPLPPEQIANDFTSLAALGELLQALLDEAKKDPS